MAAGQGWAAFEGPERGRAHGLSADLRQALGDHAKQPRYIATVHRLGYRFVAPVTPVRRPAPETLPCPRPPLPRAAAGGARGRDGAAHTHLYAQALRGPAADRLRHGRGGVGKTTLVEAVVQLAAAEGLGLGRGQCIEHYGAGEAYLPLLEALGRLGRAPGGAPGGLLRQEAPSWLAQLPALSARRGAGRPAPPAAGATQARMLRELAEALEALTAARPLVLVLEDLHWSDASTVEALALLARRREARAAGAGDLSAGGPDRARPSPQAGQAGTGRPRAVRGPPPGGTEPRQAVAAYVAQRGGLRQATRRWRRGCIGAPRGTRCSWCRWWTIWRSRTSSRAGPGRRERRRRRGARPVVPRGCANCSRRNWSS